MSNSDHTPDPKVDPETLAAFLDGRLSPEERAEVMEHLATSEDDYEAFLEAVHVLGALEESDATGPDVAGPRRSESGWRVPGARALAAAAAVAVVALGVWLVSRAGPPTDGTPVALVASLDTDPTGLPGWDEPAWPVLRSPDALLAPRERAFRLGVRHAHLAAAARADLDEASRRLAGELTTLASELPGGGPLAALYRRIGELPSGAEEAADLRREAWLATEGAAPTAELRLGAWVGAARLALLAEDLSWFRSPAAREARSAVDEESLTPPVRRGWREVRELARGDPVEPDSLGSALNALAETLGRDVPNSPGPR